MNLSTIETALGTWITTVTGLPVFWRDRSQVWSTDARAILFLSAPAMLGRDEVLEEYDANGGAGAEFTSYQLGQRQLTLEIRIETHSQNRNSDALNYALMLQDRLLLPETTYLFRQAGVSFSTTLFGPQEILSTQDKRALSIVQMDLRLNASASTAGTSYGYINTVEGETDFEDPTRNFDFTLTLE